MEHFFEESYDTALDALMDYLSNLPQDTRKTLNLKNYKKMITAAACLQELLSETIEEGEITTDVNHMFNLGSVSFVADELLIENPKVFSGILSLADNFNVYPLTNGKIRMDLTFQSVLKTIQ